jgi:hypothetical protein
MSLKHFFMVSSCCSLLSVMAQAQSSGSLTANEQQFLQVAAQTDMTQAHLGQMAQQQSDRQDVKNSGCFESSFSLYQRVTGAHERR